MSEEFIDLSLWDIPHRIIDFTPRHHAFAFDDRLELEEFLLVRGPRRSLFDDRSGIMEGDIEYAFGPNEVFEDGPPVPMVRDRMDRRELHHLLFPPGHHVLDRLGHIGLEGLGELDAYLREVLLGPSITGEEIVGIIHRTALEIDLDLRLLLS